MSTTTRRSMNRAATLRTHRTTAEDKRATQAVERVKNPVTTMPPVMTRGRVTGMAGTPGARKRTQSNVRRKYYYSLNATGAEVRLPAIPQIRLGWRLLSGVLSIVLLAGIWAMWNSSTFQVDKVRVMGAKRIAAADINTTAALSGLSILEADPGQLEKDLREAYPDIETISVQVGIPADVVVRITERTPILAWQQGQDTKWIDKQGFAFPVRGTEPGLVTIQSAGNPPGDVAEPKDASKTAAESTVPVTSAKVNAAPKPFLPPGMIDPILKMSKQVPDGAPVLYDPRYGLGWDDTKQGWKVYIGMDLENMDLKLNQYKAIVEDLNKRGIHPVMISVEFPHAPFYRLE